MPSDYWWTYKENREAKWRWFAEAKENEIRKIDADTIADGKEFGIKQEEAIKFKQRQECKLFRCVVCWHIIHPTDDEITTKGDGFAHKICVNGTKAFPKRMTVHERIDEERTECLYCHHTKRAHVNGHCCGVKTKGTASGNQKQVYWFCKCKEYTKGSRLI